MAFITGLSRRAVAINLRQQRLLNNISLYSRFFATETTGSNASSSSSSSSTSASFQSPLLNNLPSNLIIDKHTQQWLETDYHKELDYRKASEAGLPSLRVPVISLATGQSIGTEIDLDSRIFLTEIRNDIIHRVIVWQEHQNRTTLYKGKNRGEVRGGGRKPWRQKGTGRARQASIRSPLWEGGGVAHPPKLREWDTGLQRKVRRLGMRIALAAKFLDRRIMIVDKLDIITPTESTTNTAVSTDTSSSSAAVSTVPVKTKGAIQVLKTNQLLDRKVLFIYGGMNNHSKDMMIGGRTEEDSITSSPQSMNTDDITEPFVRSFANIPKCQILPSVGANVRDIIQAERIIVTVNALDQLSQRITRDM